MAPLPTLSFPAEIPSTSPGSVGITALSSDAVFWLALIGCFILIGVSAAILATALFRRFSAQARAEEDKGEEMDQAEIKMEQGLSSQLNGKGLVERADIALRVQITPLGEELDVESHLPTEGEVSHIHDTATATQSLHFDFLVPEITISPPSTPSLVDDESTTNDDSEFSFQSPPASPSLPAFPDAIQNADSDLTECLKEIDAFLDDFNAGVQVKHAPAEMRTLNAIDALLDETEAMVVDTTPTLSTFEDYDEDEDIKTTLPALFTIVEEDEAEAEVEAGMDIEPPTLPSFLEVPPVCHTQKERDEEAATSRYPRFILTKAIQKRSALKSPAKVNWKKMKKSITLPNILSGIAMSSKKTMVSITEAAKGKAPWAKRGRRDVGYIWPSESEDSGGCDGAGDAMRSLATGF